RDRVQIEQDRQRAERNLADTEFLAREVVALRLALKDLPDRDFVRAELRALLAELTEDDAELAEDDAELTEDDAEILAEPANSNSAVLPVEQNPNPNRNPKSTPEHPDAHRD